LLNNQGSISSNRIDISIDLEILPNNIAGTCLKFGAKLHGNSLLLDTKFQPCSCNIAGFIEILITRLSKLKP